MSHLYFDNSEALLERVTYAHENKRPIVFVLGAPLTASYLGNRGVLGVDEIVDLIKNEFSSKADSQRALENILKTAGQQSYQKAFEFLNSRRGPDFVNRVVQRAVLAAYSGEEQNGNLVAISDDLNGWILSPAVESLGQMLAFDSTKESMQTVLTTNFDPLIEIAIKKAGGHCFTTMMHGEGNLTQTVAQGVHVAHLHGFWHGTDTLHTARQLNQNRPQLKASLTNLVRNALIVVVAYGGWDDVITTALAELVADDSANPEIAWTFYSASHDDIEAQSERILKKLKPGLDRGRVSLFSGIDCNEFFPNLANYFASKVNIGNEKVLKLTKEHAQLAAIFDEVTPHIDPINALPKTDIWFGRDDEIERLVQSKAKAIVISGIGGQGKSSLASYYFEKKRTESDFIDWKDCREQGNTIHHAICAVIEKVTNYLMPVTELAKLPAEQLVDMLIVQLASKKGIIVFDNVDHYIDLETSHPIRTLKTLIEKVTISNTNVLFLFTARPSVRVDSTEYLELKLSGLEYHHARKLFEYRYGKSVQDESFERLYGITSGHPLWLSIIAAQSVGTSQPIEKILDGYQNFGLDLPKQMLRSTWNLLNPQQQNVLRTLAELERPEEERNIEEITELNYNRLNKALTKLKAMSLLERKVTNTNTEVLDLHPLIRQFVRDEFPKKDRESFINRVIVYIDRKLFQFKSKISGPIPYVILEMWVHKVDLLINNGLYEEAAKTLYEILTQLERNGLTEETIRLGKRLFLTIDWVHAIASYKQFDNLFNAVIREMIELSEGKDIDIWLDKYQICIAGKGAQYINLCDLKAYKNWFLKSYEQAIYWAREGVELKKKSNLDTSFDCEHTLALSLRDSGEIEQSLAFFKEGLSEENIFLNFEENKKSGVYYGNLGRCFHLSENIEYALFCYHIAARRLDEWDTTFINQGYIRYWVASIMELKGRREDSLMFHMAACEKWAKISPLLVKDAMQEIEKLVSDYPSLTSLCQTPIWKCENRFQQWINERVVSPTLN